MLTPHPASPDADHTNYTSPDAFLKFHLKGSFSNLVKLIGGGSTKGYRSDSDASRAGGECGEMIDDPSDAGDDDDRDDQDDQDEEALLWDAQTALIAHHTDLAIKIYSQAALPPYCSVAACLALGNLLTRGSSFTSDNNSPLDTPSPTSHYTDKGKGNAVVATEPTAHSTWSKSSLYSKLFGHAGSSSVNSPSSPSPPLQSPGTLTRRSDLVSAGWAIPKDGKRAVRDVEGMGVAGAWFVLGLGWMVQQQSEKEKLPVHQSLNRRRSSDDVLSFKAKSRAKPLPPLQSAFPPYADSNLHSSSSNASTEGSGETLESSMVRTPGAEGFGRESVVDDPSESLEVMYELLQPLLHLYRNGHIQAHDPVALPPISIQQLPSPLKPMNEREKRRNTWHLGGVAARRLLGLSNVIGQDLQGATSKEGERKRAAVYIMANYIAAMTAPDADAETCFRNIVLLTPTGIDSVDDLIRQASKRLNILTSTPRDEVGQTRHGFPFPPMTPSHIPSSSPKAGKSRGRHSGRVASMTSLHPESKSPRALSTRLKSAPSMASLSTVEEPQAQLVSDSPEKSSAVPTLRKLHACSSTEDTESSPVENAPTVDSKHASHWSIKTITPRNHSKEQEDDSATPVDRHWQQLSTSPIRSLRPIASSPQFSTLPSAARPDTSTSTPRRRLPFEPNEAIATIDPELAKAELASALTKHIMCGVCGMEGVNFPECRKCGLTFCSRSCRVDETKGGNGKKHVCGMWEARKMLGGDIPVVPNVPVVSVSPGPLTRVH